MLKLHVILPADVPEHYLPAIERAVRSCPAYGTLLHPPELELSLAKESPPRQRPRREKAARVRVNLTGVFLCMKHELGHMEKRGAGAIINNASILGQVGFATASAHVAAKHGVLGLTRTAALEYAAKGVRVNAVCPGFVATPMLERAGILADQSTRQSIEGMHAMNRLGTPEEVAEAVLFLASPKASFITGHPLLVDGGYVAR